MGFILNILEIGFINHPERSNNLNFPSSLQTTAVSFFLTLIRNYLE